MKNIITYVTAIFLLVVSIQNPTMAEGIIMGQTANAVQLPTEKRIDKTSPKRPETVQKATDAMAEAEQEKQTMQVIPSSEIYEEIQKKEENAASTQFINKILKSDVTRLDLRKSSGLRGTQADELLKGTGLEGLGKAFVSAEKQYHVNAYYLIAHAAWESNWGKSKISREKNNLFGYMAYDKNPYASAHGFVNKEESIEKVAQYISENYLDEKGEYYCGPHLRGMNENYATDKNWKKGIASVIVGLAQKAKEISESNGA